MPKFFIFLLVFGSFAQNKELKKINYFDHIKPIIDQNCIMCHQDGGEGPFPLTSYAHVAKRARFIQKVTEIRYMPPFPADKNFQHYKNARGLSAQEIALIRLWVENGLKEGSQKTKEAARSVQKDEWSNYEMGQTYTVKAINDEDYRYFHIPVQNQETKFITKIGFTPGNKKVDHHARVMVDTSGKMQNIEGISEKDPKLLDFQKIPLHDEYLFGWVPGNNEIEFPEGMGRPLPPQANIILNMHYAPSAVETTDKSQIKFQFATKPIKRTVKTLILRENDISNKPFIIPANEHKKFYIAKTIEKDISLLSVLPHMHLLGQNIRCFVADTTGNVIPIVKIDQWNFDWQMTYQFENLLKVPAGSVFIVEAEYDNTASNKRNPNSPPVDVTYSWGTKDEMLNVVFYYVDYEEGDEAIKQ